MARRGLPPEREVWCRRCKGFFRKAIKTQRGTPQKITLDGYATSHRAVREMKADGTLPHETKLRSLKYSNTVIEQDHHGIKLRLGPMLGFKRFRNAAIVITGIAFLRRIHKDQFDLRKLGLKGTVASAIWNAVLG